MASAVFFEEKQTNPPWIGWIVIFFGMVFLSFVLIELANRWNDPSNPDTSGPLAGCAGIILVVGVVAWLIFNNHLSVSIDREGISYVFLPTFMDAKRIEADQVESFELRKMTFSEFISSTKSKRALHKVDQQKEVCVMKGWTVADIQLRDGRRVILGTENPDGMHWALKRLQNRT